MIYYVVVLLPPRHFYLEGGKHKLGSIYIEARSFDRTINTEQNPHQHLNASMLCCIWTLICYEISVDLFFLKTFMASYKSRSTWNLLIVNSSLGMKKWSMSQFGRQTKNLKFDYNDPSISCVFYFLIKA
jgi:hypothetical protein